jgi:hypothetical protein
MILVVFRTICPHPVLCSSFENCRECCRGTQLRFSVKISRIRRWIVNHTGYDSIPQNLKSTLALDIVLKQKDAVHLSAGARYIPRKGLWSHVITTVCNWCPCAVTVVEIVSQIKPAKTIFYLRLNLIHRRFESFDSVHQTCSKPQSFELPIHPKHGHQQCNITYLSRRRITKMNSGGTGQLALLHKLVQPFYRSRRRNTTFPSSTNKEDNMKHCKVAILHPHSLLISAE